MVAQINLTQRNKRQRRRRIALPLLLATAASLLAACVWAYTPDEDRAVLEARYGPITTRTVAGIRLRVRIEGPPAAPAIILLHGFGASLETWDGWARALAASYRVIRFDLPGFGLTGPDPTGDYTDTRSIEVLAALMDSLAVDRATIIGNSLGGRIAWQFAAAMPARTTKLVLISPDGFASPGFGYGAKPDVPLLVRLLPYTLPLPLLRMSLTPAYANPAALTAPVLARYQDMLRAPGVRPAMIARLEQVRLEPPEPVLRTIAAPTLLLWGEQDRMIPFRNAQDYRAAIPHSQLAALPGLGHVPMEEAPAASLAPVLAFLAAPQTSDAAPAPR